jgi:hypothetical protein
MPMSVSSNDDAVGQALSAHDACEALFQRLGACIDDGRATDALGVFADDGVFEVGGRRYTGRAEILDHLRRRQERTDRDTRHLGANFALTRVDGDSAEARALLLVFANASTTPEVVSDCTLRFVRHPTAGWQTALRRHVRFATAPSPASGA